MWVVPKPQVTSPKLSENITLSPGSSSPQSKGQSITLSIDKIILPFCAKNYIFEIAAYTSDGFLIEKAIYTLTAASLAQMTLTSLPVVSNSTSTAAYAQHTIEINQPGYLQTDSVIVLSLPASLTWQSLTSTCAVTGITAATPSCTYDINTHSLSITNSVSGSSRTPTSGSFTAVLGNLINPKSTGTYNVQVSVKSVDGCAYAQGTYPIVIDKISQFESVSIRPNNFNLNTYIPYTLEVKPMSASIASGEYLQFKVPSGFGTTSAVECVPVSENLIQTICSVVAINTVKVMLNVDAAKYSANRTLVLNVSYIKNPSASGQFSGFELGLYSSANSLFETANLNSLVLTYGDLLSLQTVATVAFTSNLKGAPDTSKYSLFFNSHAPTGSKLVMRFSSKFKDLNFKIKESSPAMSVVAVDKSLREVILQFDGTNKPNSTISYTLEGNNPAAELIGTEDIQFDFYVLSASDLIFKISSPADRIQFVCDSSCKECGDLFSICLSCWTDFTLSGSSCVPKPIPGRSPQIKASEKSYPFAFVGISCLLALFVIIFGCMCKQRNYWGNFLYSLLRVNFVVALGVYCYYISINEDPKWLFYFTLGIVGMHVVISLVCFVKVRKAILTGSLGVQKSSNRFVNAFANTSKAVVQDSRKEFGGFFFFMLWLSILFNPNLMRWFFSAQIGKKGTFWEYDSDSFQYIKVLLQRFHMVYIFLVSILLIVVTSVSFAYNIYLFKIDMIAVCIVDIVVYAIAYFELNRFSTKPQLVKKNRTIDGYLAQPDSAKGDKSEVVDPSLLVDEEEGDKKKLMHGEDNQQIRVMPLIIDDGKEARIEKGGKKKDDLFDAEEEGSKSNRTSSLIAGEAIGLHRTEGLLIDNTWEGTKVENKNYETRKKQGDLDRTNSDDKTHLKLLKGNKSPRRVNNETEELSKAVTGKAYKPGRRGKRSMGGPGGVRPSSRGGALHRNKQENQFDVKAPFMIQPATETKKSEEGVYQPFLVDPVMIRKEVEKSDTSIDRRLEESTRNYSHTIPGIVEEDTIGFVSQNKKLGELESNLVRPVPSSFSQNNKFNKWWYTNAAQYLEIIYEQNEGEEPVIYENPDYDDKEKKFAGRTHLYPFVDWDDDGDRDDNSVPTVRSPKGIGALYDSKDSVIQEGGSDQLEDGTLGRFGVMDSSGWVKDPKNKADEPIVYPYQDAKSRLVKLQNGSNEDYEYDLNKMNQEDEEEDNMITKDDQVLIDANGKVLEINGQSLGDLNRGIVKDRNGVVMEVNKQRLGDLSRGLLADSKGNRFHAKYDSYGEVRKGLVRSQAGDLYRLKDQDYEEMSLEGVLRDHKGKVVEINGQKLKDINTGQLRVENGASAFRVEDQKDSLLEKGIILDPFENQVVLNSEQDPSEFRKGILRDGKGYPHRIIDQSMDELRRGELGDAGLKKTLEEINQASREKKNKQKKKVKFGSNKEEDYNPFSASKGKIASMKNGVEEEIMEEGGGGATSKRKKEKMIDPDLGILMDRNYYDKEGNSINLESVSPNTRFYDSLGNLIDREELYGGESSDQGSDGEGGDEDHDGDGKVKKRRKRGGESGYYDINGSPIPQSEVKTHSTMYDAKGRPVRFNNLAFIHRFYNSDGDLVDYRDLSGETVLRDETGGVVAFDPLNRRRLAVFEEEGGKYTAKNEYGEVLTGKDLAMRQRFYDEKGRLLCDEDLIKERSIYDKGGKVVGRVENKMGVRLPRFYTKDRVPVDTRDAVRSYLCMSADERPMTREDFEKEVEVFDSRGKRLGAELVEDLIDDANTVRRVYDGQGKEIEMEEKVRVARLKDLQNRPVDIGLMRKNGKLYDSEGQPVIGKVLARVADAIEVLKKSGEVDNEKSSPGINKSLNRSHEYAPQSVGKRILSTSTRRQLDMTKKIREPSSRNSNLQEGLETLHMNLLADESIDLDVNIEEVDESGDIEHGFVVDEGSEFDSKVPHRAPDQGINYFGGTGPELLGDKRRERGEERAGTHNTDSMHFIDHEGGEVGLD